MVPDSQYQLVWICVDSEKDNGLARGTPEMKLMAFTPQEKDRAFLKQLEIYQLGMVSKSECGDLSSPGILQFFWVIKELYHEGRGKRQTKADIEVGDREP